MWITFAFSGIVISLAAMYLAARKWNLPVKSIKEATLIATLTASIPFVWIYPWYSTYSYITLCLLGQVCLSLLVALTMLLYQFWRDPERFPPKKEGVIVSPADGEVIYIKSIPGGSTPIATKNGTDYSLQELAGSGLLDGKLTIIGIEMNFLNVHVNRCPIEGAVKMIKHIPGKFISLRDKTAPFLNTRCTTIIANDELMVGTVQIASRLVRKVDNYLSLGQPVNTGERLGMIRFGSQVAVIIPNKNEVMIDTFIGQHVFAGTTILARVDNKKKYVSNTQF